MDISKINTINLAIIEWFDKKKTINKVAAKELMPFFIFKGIFDFNPKDGLKIREILRKLDEKKQLHLIPSALAERKSKNTNWYFIKQNTISIVEDRKAVLNKKIFHPAIDLKKSFLPVADTKSKVIILGTLPGTLSIQQGQYYANKNNHFWKIMDAIYGKIPNDYDERCSWLLKNNIAIWDVIAHADRDGSLDKNIVNEHPNDFVTFFKEYPQIVNVCFNGQKAQNVYEKYIGLDNYRNYRLLPSSSSAHAINSNDKIKKWKDIIGSL